MAIEVGWLANPVRWSEANRKSPDLSPVNSRPVRLPPWAAGASPTTRTRAIASPKPGSDVAQYSSRAKRAGGSEAASSRHATSRGQRRQATTSPDSSVSSVNGSAAMPPNLARSRPDRRRGPRLEPALDQRQRFDAAPDEEGRDRSRGIHDRVADVRDAVSEALQQRPGVLRQLYPRAEGYRHDHEAAPVVERGPQARAVHSQRRQGHDVAEKLAGVAQAGVPELPEDRGERNDVVFTHAPGVAVVILTRDRNRKDGQGNQERQVRDCQQSHQRPALIGSAAQDPDVDRDRRQKRDETRDHREIAVGNAHSSAPPRVLGASMTRPRARPERSNGAVA